MKSTEISFALFKSFFSSSIRVQFDWERLENADANININVFDEFKNHSAWYLPWYLNDANKEVGFSTPDAHPLTLADISKGINYLNNKRIHKIQELSNRLMLMDQQPPQFVIPTYSLPNNKHLILDGNHRSAALILSGIKAKLMVFEIIGPYDKEILPDLLHWQSLDI